MKDSVVSHREKTRQIPYVNIAGQHAKLKSELLAAIGKVVDHGQFILGPEVKMFETRFAKLCGSQYAVAVNSGTDALILALRALKIGASDEVITVSNSFISTVSAIQMVGATPVFVDVREDLNIDPSLIEAAVTQKTRAILPVHLTGHMAEMDAITQIAKKHKLAVIEDSAQAVLAEFQGKRAGAWGDVGCFSVHPLKTLNACGDGGVITTSDKSIYDELLLLRNLGLENRDNCVRWSSNSRLDTIQAATLLVKLNHLESWTKKRCAHAAAYRQALSLVKQVTCPAADTNGKSVYHTFVIQAERRDNLKSFLESRGIESGVHYPIPIHQQSVAKNSGFAEATYPVAESQAKKILSLPIFPELTSADIVHICNTIRSFYQT
jgi:dTDP-4-amino-4,6-dideoxygalactose transaminase